MKERRCKDIAQFNIEYRELERIYNHETKLKAFMYIKLIDRSEIEEEAKKKEGRVCVCVEFWGQQCLWIIIPACAAKTVLGGR